jgi:hypothetical protein
VPTIDTAIKRWWARRKSAFAHPTHAVEGGKDGYLGIQRNRFLGPVIASEAKQSRVRKKVWIASARCASQ